MRGIPAISIGFAISTCTLLSAMAANDTPLNIKPGLWEVTTKAQRSGSLPIPPDALARMTPEQRARMEAFMAKQPEPHVGKRCVTQKEIDEGLDKFDERNQGKCTRAVLSSTSTLQEGRLQCTGPNNASGTYRFEAPNPQTVRGTWNMTMGDGKMTMKSDIQGRWLGADCGSVKPNE